MNKSRDIRTGRHCVFKLHVHLVFVTKYRQQVFTDIILKDLETIFQDICQDFETEIVEIKGESDHLHLLLNYPPKVSISKLVNNGHAIGIDAGIQNCRTHTGKKDLSVRLHKCPECGYTQNRDVAAAEVVRNKGLENIAVGTTVIKQPSNGGLTGAYA